MREVIAARADQWARDMENVRDALAPRNSRDEERIIRGARRVSARTVVVIEQRSRFQKPRSHPGSMLGKVESASEKIMLKQKSQSGMPIEP